MRRCANVCLAAAVGAALAGGAAASAADTIGSVTRIAGSATGTVAGKAGALVAGEPLFLDERLETGDGARLEVKLDDGTLVTLGERATLTLDAFTHSPAGANRLEASVSGAFRYISGKLAAGATRNSTVTTPVATIGVRGTDFWGGTIDGSLGVVVLEGEITVAANGLTRTLSAARAGVQVPAGLAPGAVVVWSAAKLQRALATVAFP